MWTVGFGAFSKCFSGMPGKGTCELTLRAQCRFASAASSRNNQGEEIGPHIVHTKNPCTGLGKISQNVLVF